MDTYRIGSGAGYAGDRIDPAQALAEHGKLNALVFECLAERTIALAQLRRLQDPEHGYDPLLQDRLRAVLPACVRHGTTVITNMGAANPAAAGQAALAVARELGLPKLKVGVVTGDDVLDWVRLHDVPLMDTQDLAADRQHRSTHQHPAHQATDPASGHASGHTSGHASGQTSGPTSGQTSAHASDFGDRLISANAYLGADALLPALAAGAQLIISGRVADPALFLAPLMHHFGWLAGDWQRMGQGILVGHLLECAAQVSGGYIADPGHFDVPGLADLGFPLAEVNADGSAVITKLPGTGGRVDRLTCTAQLLYEIEDPARYLQPDVVANFSQVQLHDLGADRVRVNGASGSARPAQLKATLGYRDGFIGEGQISYAGPGAVARGQLALQLLQQRLQRLGWQGLEQRAELMGVSAMHGSDLARQSGRDEPYEVRLRLALRCATRAQAERVGQEVEALYLNGPAAGGGVTQSVREVIAAASALIPRAAVRPALQMLES